MADFIWEVLLQGKVISQRPLPGIAHALVFWGFCVFALVTINHFADGVKLGFFDRTQRRSARSISILPPLSPLAWPLGSPDWRFVDL